MNNAYKGNILVVDDEEKLRNLLSRIITLEGYQIYTASTLKSGIKILQKENVDVVLCDVKLPDGHGVDFVKEVKTNYPAVEIILLTAYGNIPDGIQAMKNGAFDYITKGDDNEKIIPLLGRAMEMVKMQKRIEQLQQQVGKRYSFDNILGESPPIKVAINLAKKVAPTNATVLLLGETGTGKEVFAQAIHYGSKRSDHPFVALNCSSFSKELLESELFGHKAGAFTGAVKDKKGLIEEADSGTLFLDEIGEMQLALQAKLLRVLETGEFIKVGDTVTSSVDVRIITATNRDLSQMVKDNLFREDLFYRLNVFTIQLPPLRERKKDIALLASYFLKTYALKTASQVVSMSDDFIKHLELHSWKGNIRELKNVIERAVILSVGNELTTEQLPFDILVGSENNTNPTVYDLASVEKNHIQRMLLHTKGNKAEASRLLNIGLTTLYRKIEEYGLG